LAHIAEFIAGATMILPVNESTSVLSKSSASPAAALARKLAVAGATHSNSARSARSMCAPNGCWGVNTPLGTSRPINAANVVGPTNSAAASVMTTVTPAPAWAGKRAGTFLK
jgi:hypothetical protein